MNDPNDSRIGPWKYRAIFDVTSPQTWNRLGEVIYFVTDSDGRLRLVGQSKDRLKTRWRESPMYDPQSKRSLGSRALFHSSTWPAIETAITKGEQPPFSVSALFRPNLEAACRRIGGQLQAPLQQPEDRLRRLSYNVETWICSLLRSDLKLWNKRKT